MLRRASLDKLLIHPTNNCDTEVHVRSRVSGNRVGHLRVALPSLYEGPCVNQIAPVIAIRKALSRF